MKIENIKLSDWVVWNQRFKWKIIEYFMSSKKKIFLCMYKMYLISAERYENANVKTLPDKNGHIWGKMKDVQNCLGVTNMSDLILKELYGVYKTKNTTKEQVKEYEMTEREYYERFDNLGEKELNKKNNKETYVRNDVMTTVIKRCRGEKKEA